MIKKLWQKIGIGLLTGIVIIFGMTTLLNTRINAQSDQNTPPIETIPVANDIYMLKGDAGNIGVIVGVDGVLMIDTQYANSTDEILKIIDDINAASINNARSLRYIVNTHWHEDHTDGNKSLGKTGATIIAHDNVRKRLSTDQFIEAFQATVPAYPEYARPSLTFNDKLDLYLNNNTIDIFYVGTPAHTDGDAAIYFPDANVIHTGDIFFNKLYPFIDTSSDGGIEGMIRAVDKIISVCNSQTKIIPGHGPLSNLDEFLTYRQLLVTVKDRVKTAIENGKSLENLIASKPLAEYNEIWGQGFLSDEVFLTIVYNDLSR